MNKLNWSATQDFEYVSNYKILQACFTKLNIDRFIDVDRLISGKYMDNLEFMQWFKRYYELNCVDKGNLYIYEYMYVYIFTYIYGCIHKRIYIYICIYTYIIYKPMHMGNYDCKGQRSKGKEGSVMCIYIYTYICINIFMYIHIYVCIHKRIYIHDCM
jgi:hypothetical protein